MQVAFWMSRVDEEDMCYAFSSYCHIFYAG